MHRTTSDSGQYDDLLLECADAIKNAGVSLSSITLVQALRDEVEINLTEAHRIVDDFCERGLLQTHFGSGPYDEWLTAELEAARKANRGVNGTFLAKKLQQENRAYQADMHCSHLLGLANAIDIVDDYFVRYGLNSVLGPYPLGGILSVILTEVILSLPVFWAVHFIIGYVFLGRPINVTPFALFFLLFVAERIWRNWRKLRSPARWKSYDTARDRLPIH